MHLVRQKQCRSSWVAIGCSEVPGTPRWIEDKKHLKSGGTIISSHAYSLTSLLTAVRRQTVMAARGLMLHRIPREDCDLAACRNISIVRRFQHSYGGPESGVIHGRGIDLGSEASTDWSTAAGVNLSVRRLKAATYDDCYEYHHSRKIVFSIFVSLMDRVAAVRMVLVAPRRPSLLSVFSLGLRLFRSAFVRFHRDVDFRAAFSALATALSAMPFSRGFLPRMPLFPACLYPF
nr:hypothetical protein Iba_chr14dCG7560 [Ipomoea batatas]